MLTRSGVCYILKDSPYQFNTSDITFYFSSQLYLDKFKEELHCFRDKISESLSNRFDLDIEIFNISDIVLYSKIEKRGFYIIFNGREYTCKNNLKLRGDKARSIN